MGLFTRIGERIDRQSHLMDMMLDHLEVDRASLASELLGTRLERAGLVCMACRESNTCKRWLEENYDTAPEFCPNAQFFSRHRK